MCGVALRWVGAAALLMTLSQASVAQYEIGERALREGEYAQAWMILKPLAQAGDPRAQHDIGLMLAHGLGMPRSEREAAKWLERAANQGNIISMTRLGWMYYHGIGVERDLSLAHAYSLQAAKAGDPWAQCNVGFAYFQGAGVARDLASAVSWYRRSAEQGFALCQRNLGLSYRDGIALERNLEEAYAWLGVASAGGDRSAIVMRDQLGAKLSNLELERARTRARSLYQVHGSRMQPTTTDTKGNQ